MTDRFPLPVQREWASAAQKLGALAPQALAAELPRELALHLASAAARES